ncbi:hypothetical protein V3C99_003579, partial [Haemonchus contortus]
IQYREDGTTYSLSGNQPPRLATTTDPLSKQKKGLRIRPLDAFSCHSSLMLAQQIQLILLLICLFLLVLPSLACFGGGGGGGGCCGGMSACPSPCG